MKRFLHCLKFLCAPIFLVLFSLISEAATIYTTGGGGDWNNTATWAGGVIPGSSDAVIVNAGDNLTIDVNATCASLTFNYNSSNTTFVVDSAITFTVTGFVRFDETDNFFDGLTININGNLIANTFILNGDASLASITLNVGSITNHTAKLEIASNTLFSFDDDLSYDPVFVFNNYGFFHVKSGTLAVNNKCIGNINFNIENKMRCDANFNLTIDGSGDASINFNLRDTLDLNGTTFKLTATNNGDFSKNIFNMANNNAWLLLSSSISFGGGGGIINNTASQTSTFEYDGSALQTIYNDPRIKYHHIKINNTTGTVLSQNISASTILGDLIIASGGVFSDESYTVSITGDLINNGNYTAQGNLSAAGSFNNSGVFTINKDTLSINVVGNFTNSGTYAYNSNFRSKITLKGNWNNTGTFNYTTQDSIVFDSPSGTQTISGTTTFNRLIVDHSVGGGVSVLSPLSIKGFIDIQEGSLTTNGNITLISDVNGTASLANINAGSISGNITVQQYVDVSTFSEAQWMDFSSPVVGSDLEDWENDGLTMVGFPGSTSPNSGFVSVYTYNDSLANGVLTNGWVAATSTANKTGYKTTQAAKDFRGHHIVVSNSPSTFTLSSTGTTVSGDASMTLKYKDVPGVDLANEGWNLIGNPYACTIDWDNITAGNKVNMENQFWIYRGEAGSYESYVGGSGQGGDVTQYIPAFKGFWVHATAASPSLKIQQKDKIVNPQAFLLRSASLSYLRIKVTNDKNSYYDDVVIRPRPNGTSKYDFGLDALKFKGGKTGVPFISIVADSYELDNNCISDTAIITSQPIKVLAGKNAQGIHTLHFENTAKFFPGACVMLEDLHLGTFINLRENQEYSYQTSDTTTQARFILHTTITFAASISDVTCNGATNGSILLSAFAGSKITDIVWKNENGDTIKHVTDSVITDTLTNIGKGTFSYTLKSIGCEGTFSDTITISAPPKIKAYFETSADTVYLSNYGKLKLTNYSTKDLKYKWDFGDGSNSTIYTPKEHLYTKMGIYNVQLIVERNDHCLEYFNKPVVVLGIAPEDADCYFTRLTNARCYGSNDGIIVVKSRIEDFEKIVYKDFNGNIIDSVENPKAIDSLQNITAGKYIIHAKVCNSPVIDTIEITQPLDQIIAGFTIPNDTVIKNTQVPFTNTSVNATKYVWDFGDNKGSNEMNPIHTYMDTTGLFKITLKAFGEDSVCFDVTEQNIYVDFIDHNKINNIFDGNVQLVKMNGENYLYFNLNKSTEIELTVLNSLGQMIFGPKKLTVSNQLVPLINSAKGIHFVNISTPKGVIVKKY